MTKHYVNSVGRCACEKCLFDIEFKTKQNWKKHKMTKGYQKANKRWFYCSVCKISMPLERIKLGQCKGEA